jgi:hypothetical protein
MTFICIIKETQRALQILARTHFHGQLAIAQGPQYRDFEANSCGDGITVRHVDNNACCSRRFVRPLLILKGERQERVFTFNRSDWGLWLDIIRFSRRQTLVYHEIQEITGPEYHRIILSLHRILLSFLITQWLYPLSSLQENGHSWAGHLESDLLRMRTDSSEIALFQMPRPHVLRPHMPSVRLVDTQNYMPRHGEAEVCPTHAGALWRLSRPTDVV